MADSEGRSIRDAYRGQGGGNRGGDTGNGASEGRSIREAYRSADTGTTQQPPPAPDLDPYSGAPTAPSGSDVPAWMMKEPGRVVGAAIEGYKATPPILTPEARNALEQTGPVNRYITSPVLQLAGAGLGIMGGAAAAGQQVLYEGGEQVGNALQNVGIGSGGPRLGRDVATLGGIVPMLMGTSPGGGFNALHPDAARVAEVNRPPPGPPSPQFVSERMAPPRVAGATDADRILQLIRHDEAEKAGVGPGMQLGPEPSPAAPSPGTAPAAPQAIPNNLTPEQIAEFKNIPETLPPASKPILTQADAAARADQIINHFASIGNRTPIEGATGALPTITGNSGLATLYRAVRDSDTPVPFTTLENASKAKAMDTLEKMGATSSQASKDRLATATEKRASTTAPMYRQAFENKTAADTAGSTKMVEDFLQSAAKQNDNLRPELQSVQKRLAGETDPEQLKGIADNIDTTLDKLGTEGKADRQTRRVLGQVKDQIISEIGPAAPGFDAAQAEYSRQSRGIDRMKYFQGRKLTDLQGNPTLGNMRSMLDDIAKKQAGDKFHPADSVTPDDIKTLRGIHDQMQREQLTATAGKALGSNTFQNLATNARVGGIAGHMGNALLGTGGAIADLYLGGYGITGAMGGNMLAEGGKYIGARRAASAAAREEAGRTMLMQELRDRLLNIDNKGVRALSPSAPSQ